MSYIITLSIILQLKDKSIFKIDLLIEVIYITSINKKNKIDKNESPEKKIDSWCR
jgi:hypothetical protein